MSYVSFDIKRKSKQCFNLKIVRTLSVFFVTTMYIHCSRVRFTTKRNETSIAEKDHNYSPPTIVSHILLFVNSLFVLKKN